MKSLHVVLVTMSALLVICPEPAETQYFGRNKVQYDRFDFQVLETPRFDLYFSLGPTSSLTGMWLRDAVLRGEFPTLQQMTREQRRYFP